MVCRLDFCRYSWLLWAHAKKTIIQTKFYAYLFLSFNMLWSTQECMSDSHYSFIELNKKMDKWGSCVSDNDKIM
jgi:hypothetical protein